jgi:DNA-binding CsgD family transcriptional regulator
LFVRAEGNPFFTEQLAAAALVDAEHGGRRVPAGLPARLAELLTARAARCTGDAQTVLEGLAVVGRPLTEDQVRAVTGLGVEPVRRGLRELAAARLLADSPAEAAYRPRHALLAEAVAGGLLPGERVMLHERAARALAGDQALAAEVAGHWQAAGRPAEEFPARVAAAEVAGRVFGYAEAAAQWQRAIELCLAQPGIASTAGMDVPRLYARAVDAFDLAGDGVRAGELAEQAYHRFAGHPDPATAAVIYHRAALFRAIDAPAAGLPLIEQALQLFGQAPPSAEHAEAWFDFAHSFLRSAEGRLEDSHHALNRALEIAEAARATALIPRILASQADNALLRGQVKQGLAFLQRGQALAEAAGDGPALVWLAVAESNALLKLAKFQNAAEMAVRGLDAAGQAGLAGSWRAGILAANAAEALLALGRTGQAAALLDPLTPGPPDRDHWPVHVMRAEFDVLPGDALADIRRTLARFQAPDLTILCGRLLAAGMRACADLAEQARARRDQLAAEAAAAAADGLVSWVERMDGAPFTDHPFVAAIPAERATWEAERTRLAGPSDLAAWRGAAKAWQDLGCPHWAAYAWWRQAQTQLGAGQPPAVAAAALRAAADAADGHQPLLAQIRALAQRARIPLQARGAATTSDTAPEGQPREPHGLTGRELAVLRLLAAGRTNAQIGAELYISPRTAGVHVTSILRKLGVSSRVQAAAVAERAGLLH